MCYVGCRRGYCYTGEIAKTIVGRRFLCALVVCLKIIDTKDTSCLARPENYSQISRLVPLVCRPGVYILLVISLNRKKGCLFWAYAGCFNGKMVITEAGRCILCAALVVSQESHTIIVTKILLVYPFPTFLNA